MSSSLMRMVLAEHVLDVDRDDPQDPVNCSCGNHGWVEWSYFAAHLFATIDDLSDV